MVTDVLYLLVTQVIYKYLHNLSNVIHETKKEMYYLLYGYVSNEPLATESFLTIHQVSTLL